MRTKGHTIQTAARRGRRGFTLAEALLASMVLAIVAGSAVLPVLAGVQQQKAADQHRYAVVLAAALMEEVLARPYLDPAITDDHIGPSGIETSRKAFRTIDAFDDYSESGDMLRGYDEAALAVDPDLANLWREVTVEYVAYGWQPAGCEKNLMLVRVTIYRKTGSKSDAVVNLTRLVSREGV